MSAKLSNQQWLRLHEIELHKNFSGWVVGPTPTPCDAQGNVTHPAFDLLIWMVDVVGSVYAAYWRKDGEIVGVKVYPNGELTSLFCDRDLVEKTRKVLAR